MTMPRGLFDPSLVNEGWADPELKIAGWFSDEMIDIEATAGKYVGSHSRSQVYLGVRSDVNLNLGPTAMGWT